MLIQTIKTPNNNTMKFIPGIKIIKNNYKYISKNNLSYKLNYINKIFIIKEIKYIFLGYNFISVTKKKYIKWNKIKIYIISILIDFLNSNIPVLDIKNNINNLLLPIEKKIINILKYKVLPILSKDGGSIIFYKYKNNILFIELQGACKNCPNSFITLKKGIKKILNYFIPSIKLVKSI